MTDDQQIRDLIAEWMRATAEDAGFFFVTQVSWALPNKLSLALRPHFCFALQCPA